jgi:hypothetical protein
VVTQDPDDANDITVQLEKLIAIYTQREIYRVESTHKEVFFGVLMPDSLPGCDKIVNSQLSTADYFK